MATAAALVALVLTACGGDDTTNDDTTDDGTTNDGTTNDGDIPEGEPTSPTTAIELCEPAIPDDTIGDRSDFALVACDAPPAANLSIVHVTPPANQDTTIQARSSADPDETPRVTLQARGLWPGAGTGVTTVDGDSATFGYTLFWYAEGTGTDDRVERDFEDEISIGDSITHGPLTYDVLGITDTGDPETSHLDLAVYFDPPIPLDASAG